MNNFERCLKILQEEQSDLSNINSAYIFNMLFSTNNDIEPIIEHYFPLDEDDRFKITSLASIIEQTSEYKLMDFRKFTKFYITNTSIDLLLSILNKYFTTTNIRTKRIMKNFLYTQCNNKLIYLDKDIENIWIKFNKRFADKPISDS